jgi:hypothetical protein
MNAEHCGGSMTGTTAVDAPLPAAQAGGSCRLWTSPSPATEAGEEGAVRPWPSGRRFHEVVLDLLGLSGSTLDQACMTLLADGRWPMTREKKPSDLRYPVRGQAVGVAGTPPLPHPAKAEKPRDKGAGLRCGRGGAGEGIAQFQLVGDRIKPRMRRSERQGAGITGAGTNAGYRHWSIPAPRPWTLLFPPHKPAAPAVCGRHHPPRPRQEKRGPFDHGSGRSVVSLRRHIAERSKIPSARGRSPGSGGGSRRRATVFPSPPRRPKK